MNHSLKWIIAIVAAVLATPSKASGQATSDTSKLHVYLLIGQSNMAGRGDLSNEPTPIYPRVLMFTEQNQWARAVEPLQFDKKGIAGAGLGASFAQTMAEEHPEVTIGLVPCAVGGTPLSRWQKGGDLYQQAIVRIRSAMKAGVLQGVLWHQGEQAYLRHHDRRDADRQHARDDLPPAREHAAHRDRHQSASARHEPLSHHARGKADASQRRDIAQSELLAGFLDKLKATKEADGSSLFDHIALAYGSNIRTGHELSNCPTILTGGGAGLKLGHNIVAPKDTPLCNAWLAMLHGIGVQAERHGDSTGPLKEIIA